MSRWSRSRIRVVGLAVALGFVASCDGDSDGTGPVSEGDIATMAAALEGVMDDYFTAPNSNCTRIFPTRSCRPSSARMMRCA